MEGMEGMVCDGCTAKVKNALEEVEGVTKAEVDLAKATAVVTYDPDKTTIEAMQQAVLENANFQAVVVEPKETNGLFAAVVKPGDTCCGNCQRGR
ncbi:MAG: heavy-metal-associated domain-containing protein [Acidobacteria bacterium]|nr:heavy-metal-associated domain-containing protein [Acidobacteriota bacterium]